MKQRKFIFLLLFSSLLTIVLINTKVKSIAAEDLGPTGDLYQITKDYGYKVGEQYKPKASIVIDALNGQVLWQDNPDVPRNPASMTKAMAVYLVYEAMNANKFTPETKVMATPVDEQISNIYEISNKKIYAGVEYPVSALLKMALIPSSNAATVMLGNLVADGNPGKFVDMMNEKAKELGMENTFFSNISGAEAESYKGLYNPEGYDPTAGNITTARDLAILGYNIVNKYPQILDITKKAQVTVMEGAPYQDIYQNYNYSLPGEAAPNGQYYGYEGVDGIKTGSSPGGDYNYMATCQKEGMRVIEVIMGVGTWEDEASEFNRHIYGNALLDKIYNDYSQSNILVAGEHDIDNIKVETKTNFNIVKNKDTKPEFLLDNDKLVMKNSLPLASKKFIRPQVEYVKVKKGILNSNTNNTPISENNENKNKYTPLIPLSLGVISLIFSKLIPPRTKGQRQRNPKLLLIKKIALGFSLIMFLASLLQFIL